MIRETDHHILDVPPQRLITPDEWQEAHLRNIGAATAEGQFLRLAINSKYRAVTEESIWDQCVSGFRGAHIDKNGFPATGQADRSRRAGLTYERLFASYDVASRMVTGEADFVELVDGAKQLDLTDDEMMDLSVLIRLGALHQARHLEAAVIEEGLVTIDLEMLGKRLFVGTVFSRLLREQGEEFWGLMHDLHEAEHPLVGQAVVSAVLELQPDAA